MKYRIQIKMIPRGHMDYYSKDTIVLRYDIINKSDNKEILFGIASQKRITLKLLIDGKNKKKMILKQNKKKRSHSGWKNGWSYQNKYKSLQKNILYNKKYYIVKNQGNILRGNKFGTFYDIYDINKTKGYFIDGALNYKEKCKFVKNTEPITYKYMTLDKKTFFKLFELNDEIFQNLHLI